MQSSITGTNEATSASQARHLFDGGFLLQHLVLVHMEVVQPQPGHDQLHLLGLGVGQASKLGADVKKRPGGNLKPPYLWVAAGEAGGEEGVGGRGGGGLQLGHRLVKLELQC